MLDSIITEKIKRKNKNLALLIALVALVSFCARAIVTYFYIDPLSGFYITDNPFILSIDYIIAAVLICIVASRYFFYRRSLGDERRTYHETAGELVQGTQTIAFSASLSGFMMISAAIIFIYSFFSGHADTAAPLADYFVSYVKDNPFDFALCLACFPASVYFFKTAALNPERHNTSNPRQMYLFFSFMPSIWVYIRLFDVFFDMSIAINSNTRIYELMCLVSILLYFVSESRFLTGNRQTAPFYSFAYTSIMLISVSSLVNLLLSSFWMLETNTPTIVFAVEAAFLVYIISRVYSQLRYGSYGPEPEPAEEKKKSVKSNRTTV